LGTSDYGSCATLRFPEFQLHHRISLNDMLSTFLASPLGFHVIWSPKKKRNFYAKRNNCVYKMETGRYQQEGWKQKVGGTSE
jgi:hypothetical protein